jgi:hypothetical protein
MAKPVAVFIATDEGMVPTGTVEGEPVGVGAVVGCTARLRAAIDPFGEPVPQGGVPLGGQDTVLVTVMG